VPGSRDLDGEESSFRGATLAWTEKPPAQIAAGDFTEGIKGTIGGLASSYQGGWAIRR